MDKTYAVFIGRQPGVYNTWEDANVQVSGFKHQTHRSFSSREEAVAALSKFQVGEHVGSYSEVRSSITSASNSSSSGPGSYSSKQAVEKSYQSHKE